MKTRELRRRSGGFSLIELLIVVVIILVVAAIATPNIMQAMQNFRLRSSATALAQVTQRTRMEALSANQVKKLGWAWTFTGSTWYMSSFIDSNANWMIDANLGENVQVARMPANIWLGWGPDTSTMQLDFVAQPLWWQVAFNEQGVPCVYNWGGGACQTTWGGQPVGFVMYMYQHRDWNPTGYAAVTVSPAGRVRVWTWSGTRWQ